MRVTLKVTPRNIVFRLWVAIILCASSMTAERPRCGSAPECDGKLILVTPYVALGQASRHTESVQEPNHGRKTYFFSVFRRIYFLVKRLEALWKRISERSLLIRPDP